MASSAIIGETWSTIVGVLKEQSAYTVVSDYTQLASVSSQPKVGLVLVRVEPNRQVSRSIPVAVPSNDGGDRVEVRHSAYFLNLRFATVCAGSKLGELYDTVGIVVDKLNSLASRAEGRSWVIHLEEAESIELGHLLDAVKAPLGVAIFFRCTVLIDSRHDSYPRVKEVLRDVRLGSDDS